MIHKVYKERKGKKVLQWFLEETKKGVDLKFRTENGDEWYVLEIMNDGKNYLPSSIPLETGLALDEGGRLKIT